MAGGVGGRSLVCMHRSAELLNSALVLTSLIRYYELYFGRLLIQSISQPFVHFCRL